MNSLYRKVTLINYTLFLIACMSIFYNLSYSQHDTLHVTKDVLRMLNGNATYFGGVYKINDSVVEQNSYDKFRKEQDSLWSIVYECVANLKYFKFYDSNNGINQEGQWQIEFWYGSYKKYHPNGKVAEIGSYSQNETTLGNKMGIWKYYSESGKLKLEEIYNDKGELVKIKKH